MIIICKHACIGSYTDMICWILARAYGGGGSTYVCGAGMTEGKYMGGNTCIYVGS